MTYVQQHYHRPMSLGDVAAALKMNAAYLSSLFSVTAGVTFHKYLEGVRLSKARELLRNSHNRVCEVACAVGYASADQFRHAFKVSVGVPPSTWR
jgi:two-component system response regulator YesN